VTNSTIYANSATNIGGGIVNALVPIPLSNTIIANNIGGNCSGNTAITDAGYNPDDGITCGFSQATGSLSNTNPLLDPAGLQDNGGPTPTIALLPGSPAVDLVGDEACPPPQQISVA
jgi:hypothetical protein